MFPDLSPLFNPASVAIVGASQDTIRLGGRPIDYMLRYGYAGDIYPVHPTLTTIQGLTAYPSLDAINAPVELAVLAVSAKRIEDVVQSGIRQGVKAFVVFSSGYAELDDAGRAAQERLAHLCAQHNVLLLGPNCIGCADSRSHLIASFSTAMEASQPIPGRFGLVTQSGALGSYWLAMVDRAGLGFSQFIATGNEAGVDLAQGIAALSDHDDTDVIGVYIESIKDAHAFRQAALKAAMANKTIIAIKAGRSDVGAQAAASHTGALAGEDATYQALFDQYGIIRVDSLSEMIDTAKLVVKQPRPAGNRIGVVTISGGAGVLLADELTANGLTLPDFSEATKAQLRTVLPSFIHPRNPLDHTAAVAGDPVLFDNVIRVVGRADDHDAYIVFSGLMDRLADQIIASLKAAFQGTTKQLGVVWLGASEFVIKELEAAGIPVFADIPQATRAFTNVAIATQRQASVKRRANEPTVPANRRLDHYEVIPEWRAMERLTQLGDITIPKQRMVAVDDNIVEVLASLKYPLVAKLQSAALPHRSDHGGVILNLTSHEDAVHAVTKLFALANTLGIKADGVLLQQMNQVDTEFFVGLKVDATFGPLLVVGRGGVDVELRPDVRTALLPLTPQDIHVLLLQLDSAALLQGYRGRQPANIARLAEQLHQLTLAFTEDESLLTFEINPLALTTEGHIVALDAMATTTVV